MKKKLILLAVLVLVFVGAVAALMLLNMQPPVAEEEPVAASSAATETLYVVGGNPNPFVTTVKIQNELDSFTIVNNHPNAVAMQNATAPDFEIEGLPKEYLAQSLMKTIATNVAALDAKQAVEGGDLAAFGLDTPQATVDVAYEDGTATFEIGDEAPGGSGTYVAKDGAVYLVTSSKLTNMLLSRYGFVNKTVTEGSSGADGQTPPTSFTKAVIGGTSQDEPVVIEAPEKQNEELASAGITSFRITSPVEADADVSGAVQPLSSAFGLTATEVVGLVEEPDALKTFGLAEPYLTTEITTEDPAVPGFTLQISEADGEGNVFLRRLDRPFIYKLPAASIAWYGLGVFDYMSKMAILPFIDTVAEVDVVVDGDQVTTFLLEGEGDEMVVTANGTTIDLDFFKKFYQTLISASYEAETDGEQPDPAATPVLQYVYRYRDGKEPDIVTFLPGPARRYFMRLNDGTAFYTRSLYVDTVLADLPTLLAGEEVDSYF